MKLREDPSAVGQVIAFLMASGILMASVGAVLLATEGVGSEARTQSGTQAVLEADAQSLLKVLLGSPGHTFDGSSVSSGWTPFGENSDADVVSRLGIRCSSVVTDPEAACFMPNGSPGDNRALDFDKLRNLRLSPFAAANDGYVNYEEALAALGLDEKGVDFHIRAKPALRSVQELLESGFGRDKNLRISYIGDAERTSGDTNVKLDKDLGVDTPTCIRSPESDYALRLSILLENGGITTTQFGAIMDVTFGADDHFVASAYGGLVLKNATSLLYIDIPATTGRDCSTISELVMEIHDPISTISSQSWDGSIFSDSVSPNPASRTMTIEPATNLFRVGESVTLVYDGDLKSGKGSDPIIDRLILKVFRADNGLKSVDVEFAVPKKAEDWKQVVAKDYLGVGLNKVTLQLKGTNLVVTNHIVVVEAGSEPKMYSPAGGGAFTYAWQESAYKEAAMIDQLVEQFCATEFLGMDEWLTPTDTKNNWNDRCAKHHIPKDTLTFRTKSVPTQFGDVFPDMSNVMDSDLPARLIDDATGLPRYDLVNVLVVGSNVDHSAMTKAHAKHSVRDWVMGGGTLIVLGSTNQAVQWLQPIFHSGIKASNTGLNTPDVGHPLLNVPNPLPYDAYDNDGRVWSFLGNGPSAPDQFFTQVVEDEDGHPVMAISDSGAYGKGTIILTTYMAHDVFGDGSDSTGEAGMALLHNVIIQGGYRDLFLDYGPSLPQGFAVVPALGFAEVWHPELEMMVTLEVTLFVFPNVRG